MAAPITNQSYTQQNNQLFEWAKTATPQQIEAAKQGLPKDSPLLLAIGMGVQYQQQARAPHPQAPQKTIMEQKLSEFTQTSPQGLPQVGQNQMAMQQAAQQNPMFGAGIAVAPENTEQAPAPQQMAATGGITALARGGEVRGFVVGGAASDPLNNIDSNTQPDNSFYNNAAAYWHGGLRGGLANVAKQYKQGFNWLLDSAEDIGKGVLYGADGPPPEAIVEAPAPKGKTREEMLKAAQIEMDEGKKIEDAIANRTKQPSKPTIKATQIQEDVRPDPKSSAAKIAVSPTAIGESYQTADQTLKDIMKFRGPEADMSEEVGLAKEYAANARRDKNFGGIASLIAGTLGSTHPSWSQALGEGAMSGLSAYQSGAKEEQGANKDLMAMGLASKKAKLASHREAADLIIAKQTAIDAAKAASYNKILEEIFKQNLAHANTADIKQMEFKDAREVAILKHMLESNPTMHQDQTLVMSAIKTIMDNDLTKRLSDDEITQKAKILVATAKEQSPSGSTSTPKNPLGNGVFLKPAPK